MNGIPPQCFHLKLPQIWLQMLVECMNVGAFQNIIQGEFPIYIPFIIVNLDRYHTTNRPAAHANEKVPLTGGCPPGYLTTEWGMSHTFFVYNHEDKT